MVAATSMHEHQHHLQIGELARATGLTVRTLHHYDAIGLLVPEERSASGRRLYSVQEVRRLYRIVGLRRLGLSLEEIVVVLDEDRDLTAAVRRHLGRVEQGLDLQRRLHRRLTRMLEVLEQEDEPGVDEFIQAIEGMTMIEKYYTPEQLDQLERRRKELGEEQIRASESEWGELIALVRAEQAAGASPTGPRMLELAGRWKGLIEQFTGGDAGIAGSLTTMYREEGVETASRGMVDPELAAYVSQALAGLRDG